jgi:hypothetical protein
MQAIVLSGLRYSLQDFGAVPVLEQQKAVDRRESSAQE